METNGENNIGFTFNDPDPSQKGSAPQSDVTEPSAQSDVTEPSANEDQNKIGFTFDSSDAPSPKGRSAISANKNNTQFPINNKTKPEPKFNPQPDNGDWENTPWSTVGQYVAQQGLLDPLYKVGSGAVKGVYGLVRHPLDTTSAIENSVGQLISGAGTKLGEKLGFNNGKPLTPEEQNNEAFLDSALNHIYTFTDLLEGKTGKLKESLSKDWTSPVMDASTLLGGLGAGAKGVGAAADIEALSSVGKALAKTSQYTNPAALAIKTAALPLRLAGGTMRIGQSIATGVPRENLAGISDLASSGNMKNLGAFARQWSGVGDAVNEIPRAMNDAFLKWKNNMFSGFKKSKAIAAASAPGAMNDFSDVDAAVKNADDFFAGTGPTHFPEEYKALQNIKAEIAAWKANKSLQTLPKWDQLRASIGNIQASTNSGKITGPIYQAVRGTMAKVSPEYVQVLEDTTDGMAQMKNLISSLGVGGSAASRSAALAKAIKNMKTGTGRDLIGQLAKYDPRIPHMIAGAMTRPWATESGFVRGLEQVGGAGGIMAAAANPALWFPLIKGAIGAAVFGSPKLAAATNVLTGAAYSPVRATTALSRAGYYANKSAPEGVPTDQQSTDLSDVKRRVASAESAGSGGYNAIGPAKKNGDRPFGKYQVMASNIPQWTSQYVGREMTPEEFLRNPEAQERVFEGAFGDALKKYGNEKDALSWWHSNHPLAEAQNRKDVLGTTTPQYVAKVTGHASGGRIERASGGKVDGDLHENLVNRLMNMAKQAKKVSDKTTEPLLNVPDEAIVKALGVAQEAI